MPMREDLAAAVAEGVIDTRQADRLAEFLDARSRGEILGAADREEVRFARGFHDVFLTLGIGLLFLGLATASSVTGYTLAISILSAVLAWGLAEFFARKHHLVLPSMALSVIFVIAAAVVGFLLIGNTVFSPRDLFSPSFAMLVGTLIALVASGAFFLRFRLPFALGVIAATIVVTIVVVVGMAKPGFVEANLELLILQCGIAIFACAMAFDLTDPQRRTLRSDNAFWLHLLAAPLILNGVFGLVTGHGALDTATAIVIVAVVLLLGLVAVVIDRRALLVAGLAYLGFALARLIQTTDLEAAGVAALTLVVLGTAVVFLGAGWRRMRSSLIAVLPLPTRLVTHLPATTDLK